MNFPSFTTAYCFGQFMHTYPCVARWQGTPYICMPWDSYLGACDCEYRCMDGMQPQTGLGPVSLLYFYFYFTIISYRRIAVVKIDHNISRDDSCYILLLAIVICLQCSWCFLSLAQSNCEMIKCRSRSKEIKKYSLTQKRRLISRFLTQLSRKGKGIND